MARKKNHSDRYQDQPWHIKLYRRVRCQWKVPFTACSIWHHERTRPLEARVNLLDPDGPLVPDWRLSFRKCWSLAVALSQGKMKWYYDWDEVKQRLDRK